MDIVHGSALKKIMELTFYQFIMELTFKQLIMELTFKVAEN